MCDSTVIQYFSENGEWVYAADTAAITALYVFMQLSHRRTLCIIDAIDDEPFVAHYRLAPHVYLETEDF